VIKVSDTMVKLVARAVAKETLVALVKFVPVMVTRVPPPVLPEDGLTAVIVGTGTAA
jgi:hypothetical protein